jgi:phenylacetate-CoA ligase
MNEQFLSVYDESELNLKRLREMRPHVLVGFPSVLMVIGEELNKRETLSWRPKLLFTLGEVLTNEDRQILTAQWRTRPIDLYAANEVGHIAFQCPGAQGYHINLDSVHVEILAGERPAKLGERGEVVVTNLDLRVMPIVRYRLGDVSYKIEGNCPCGCRFPMLGRITGRSDGFIRGADGKAFSALEVSLLLKPVQGIKRYRLLQDSKEQVCLQWVAAEKNPAREEEIRKILSARLGSNIQIEIQRVAKIPKERSGKIRSVISSLPHPFARHRESLPSDFQYGV